MKERESVKLIKSVEYAKPIPMGHQQIPWHCLALLAIDNLELELA